MSIASLFFATTLFGLSLVTLATTTTTMFADSKLAMYVGNVFMLLPMTIAMLMENTWRAACRRQGVDPTS